MKDRQLAATPLSRCMALLENSIGYQNPFWNRDKIFPPLDLEDLLIYQNFERNHETQKAAQKQFSIQRYIGNMSVEEQQDTQAMATGEYRVSHVT